MIIIINATEFANSLNKIKNISKVKTLSDITKNVLLTADRETNTLKIIANNLSFGAAIEIPAAIEEPGTISVDAKTLITNLTHATGSIRIKKALAYNTTKEIIFAHDSGKFSLIGDNADNFPSLPEEPAQTKVLKIKAQTLLKALQKTNPTAAESNIRPMLAGVCLKFRGNEMIFAATDSFRLVEYTTENTEYNAENFENFQAIFPKDTNKYLIELLKKETSNINISFSGDMLDRPHKATIIIENLPNLQIKTRLLVGNFPNYEGFFPKEHTTKSTIEKKQLETIVKQAKEITKQTNHNIKITSTQNEIKIFQNGEVTFAQTLPAELEGNGDTMGINAAYLLDAIKTTEGKKISFRYKTNLSPIIVASDDEPNMRTLIMPLKI